MMETLRTAVNELGFGNKEEPTQVPTQPLWDESRPMKCLVWNGKRDFQYVDHARPMITDPRDILLRVTATTICGSDLHLYKGTFMGMRTGDIPGHEFMGVIENVGDKVTKLHVGQRVVVAFCVSCGECEYCKREEFSSCGVNNPSKLSGELLGERPMGAYGYSHLTGAIPGGQAEYVRVANADFNCLPIPDELPDEKALYLTDMIPTGYHGAILGGVTKDSIVGIWGLGPIGLMCARWCQFLGAKKIIGIDTVPERLALARSVLKIPTIDFHDQDVAKTICEILDEACLDVAIDCVGFDFPQSWLNKLQMKLGLQTDTPEVISEMFKCVRKCGRVALIGDYYAFANNFPVGFMMEKGLTVVGGQCPVQKYWKFCLSKVRSGEIDPLFLITDRGSLADAPTFYEKMANQSEGCIKVFMRPENY